MSVVKIQGNANGNGTITFAAPNTDTDRNITIPDSAGELLLANGDGSNLTGITTGKILQVVQTGAPAGFSTTNSTVQDTGHDASITPSSSSNKILVTVSWVGYNNSTGRTYKAYLYRGATKIYGQHLGEDSGIAFMSNSIVKLDSPSTTSSVTYTMYVGTDGVGTAYYSGSHAQGASTITLMEIAA